MRAFLLLTAAVFVPPLHFHARKKWYECIRKIMMKIFKIWSGGERTNTTMVTITTNTMGSTTIMMDFNDENILFKYFFEVFEM